MNDVSIPADELRKLSIWEIYELLDPQQWDWRAERDAASLETPRPPSTP